MADKNEELKKLAQQMEADKSLPLREANFVFGEGNPDAPLMFIGEGPGAEEDKQGRPFVGRGGQLLRQALKEAGIGETDFYITNIIKRRPPNNRDPLPEEIKAYAPYLKKQVEIIKPKVIATLGRFAMNYFLPNAKISRDHSKAFRKNDVIIYPIFHPAAALRNPDILVKFKESIKKLPVLLKKADEILSRPPKTGKVYKPQSLL